MLLTKAFSKAMTDHLYEQQLKKKEHATLLWPLFFEI